MDNQPFSPDSGLWDALTVAGRELGFNQTLIRPMYNRAKDTVYRQMDPDTRGAPDITVGHLLSFDADTRAFVVGNNANGRRLYTTFLSRVAPQEAAKPLPKARSGWVPWAVVEAMHESVRLNPEAIALSAFGSVAKALGYDQRHLTGIRERLSELNDLDTGRPGFHRLRDVFALHVSDAVYIAGEAPHGQEIVWTTMGLVFPGADPRPLL